MDLEQVEEQWREAYHEILDVLYHEATPGLNYEALETGELVDQRPPTYLRHYLNPDRQEELIEDVLESYDIPEDLYFEAKKSVLLSAGPSASKQNVERARIEAGLEPLSELLDDDVEVKKPEW